MYKPSVAIHFILLLVLSSVPALTAIIVFLISDIKMFGPERASSALNNKIA